jgi:hypothetical protein
LAENFLVDTPLADIIPGRLRLSDSASELSFRRIINWVTSCEMGHPCARSMTPLPTRVLDVGLQSQYVKLVETVDKPGIYTTLSHCWGNSDVITTTRKTINARKEGIALRDLPQTFLDAILITRRLHIKYLWIDSLCIIQDSSFDWERESQRMAGVYANSFLTIAASSSTDSFGGCFPSWSSRSSLAHISPHSASLGRTNPVNAAPVVDTRCDPFIPNYLSWKPFADVGYTYKDQTSRVYIYSEWTPSSRKSKLRPYYVGGSLGGNLDPLELQPLNSRGWTVQERLISRRILHFGTDQMYWECRLDFIAEDGTRFVKSGFSIAKIILGQQLPFAEHGFGLRKKTTRFELIVTSPFLMTTPPWGRWDGGWLALIEIYSKRKLSRGDDKLPALSGLARFIADQTADEYYAGLWRNHILEDLYWLVDKHKTDGKKLCDVPATCRAPSWSWAYLDSYIKFIPLDFDHIVAEFICADTTPAGDDPFGKVTGGLIKLWVGVNLFFMRFHANRY